MSVVVGFFRKEENKYYLEAGQRLLVSIVTVSIAKAEGGTRSIDVGQQVGHRRSGSRVIGVYLGSGTFSRQNKIRT